MKKLLIVLLSISFFACSKNANNQNIQETPTAFFKNADEAASAVTSAIKELHLGLELKSIGHISYLRSGNKDLALIFYASTKGEKSMVVSKQHTASVMDDGVSVTICDDGNCDCKVKVIFYNDGSIDVGCSCPSCKMITTSGLIPQSVSQQQ